MTVACHPVAYCSERTSVAGCAVVTRMVSSPHGVVETTCAVAAGPPRTRLCTQARPDAEACVKILKGPIMPR
jgi:hypothetical protein